MNNTTNKILLIILIVLIVLAGGLAWFVFGEKESTPVAEGGCSADITVAEETAEGQMCTQQFQDMRCPYDENVVYGARNGCIIGELSQRGWKEVDVSEQEHEESESQGQ